MGSFGVLAAFFFSFLNEVWGFSGILWDPLGFSVFNVLSERFFGILAKVMTFSQGFLAILWDLSGFLGISWFCKASSGDSLISSGILSIKSTF